MAKHPTQRTVMDIAVQDDLNAEEVFSDDEVFTDSNFKRYESRMKGFARIAEQVRRQRDVSRTVLDAIIAEQFPGLNWSGRVDAMDYLVGSSFLRYDEEKGYSIHPAGYMFVKKVLPEKFFN